MWVTCPPMRLRLAQTVTKGEQMMPTTKPTGPKTVVHRIRFNEADYKVLRTCWVRNNPKDLQSYHEWIRDKLHDLAEECRKAGVKPCA